MFHFGTSMEPLVFDELALSGWLLHRDGKPINGIRAIVKRKFARRKIVRARRKRRRRDVEAAFPHLPEAKISGFLFELRLPLGRNHLTFQVFDHEHIWRTFYTATIFITTRGCVSGRRIIESVSFRTSFVSTVIIKPRCSTRRSCSKLCWFNISLIVLETCSGGTSHVARCSGVQRDKIPAALC
jgi:hypothetical protein